MTKIREELQYDGYDLLLPQPTPPAIAHSELTHAHSGDALSHAAAAAARSAASVSAAEGRVVDLDL